MGMTPQFVEAQRQIERYGDGGFTISGQRHEGSALVWAGHVEAWEMPDAASLTIESLSSVLNAKAEILLIGCGAQPVFIPPAFRQHFKSHGLIIDAMDTGAACRTYNILLSESRRVVAALIAV